MRENKLFIICPCYNEEAILKNSIEKLTELMDSLVKDRLISRDSKIICVDDGSKDKTWDIIEETSVENNYVRGIKLSRNFGQYSALMAGYMHAKKFADFCISLDVDLQDDISVIPDMVKKYLNGCEVVLAIRNDRSNDSFMKKVTAEMYYGTLKLLGVKMIKEHPDYRLLSKKALVAMEQYEDNDVYIRSIVPRLGFKTDTVSFKRQKREAGTTKYNYIKLIQIAIKGIVKSSNTLLLFPILPILVTILGMFIHIKVEVYWCLLFMCILCYGFYIGDIKTQAHNAPNYTIEKITKDRM